MFLTLTFPAAVLVLPVDEEVAGALGEPGQDEQLHHRRDTRGGQQDGPVLFSAQKLSARIAHDNSKVLESEERAPPVTPSDNGSAYLRPTTCPMRIPAVRKMEVPIPMAPRSAVGAISPKYRG